MTRTASLAVAAIALIALAGCATAAEPEAETSANPSATPEPSAEPTPSASEEPEGIDTSDWLEYASEDGEVSLRYPADWSIETMTTPPIDGLGPNGSRQMDSVELTAPNGQLLLSAYDVVDLGGACDPESVRPVEVLATEPLAESTDTTIATLAIGTVDGRWTFGAGLISGGVDARETCYVNFLGGGASALIGTTSSISSTGADPLWTVDTLDDATAYMETDEYATILEILRSVRTA